MSRNTLMTVGIILGVGFSLLGPVGDVFAQRVWVGGGGVRVRAPFVRVDVGPNGGVSVRAPFTAIDVPPDDFYYEPYPVVIRERIVEPAFPTAAELAAMDDARLHERVLWIAESLQRRLSRFDTGETWQRYFRFPDVALSSSNNPEMRREALIKLLERFQKVAADPQYAMISSLPAFVAMEAALMEAVSRPDGGPSGIETPVEAEELPLPGPAQPVPPQSQQQLPAPQQPIPPQRDGPFLRPKSAP